MSAELNEAEVVGDRKQAAILVKESVKMEVNDSVIHVPYSLHVV